MLAGAHGWKHESFALFTHLRNEIFHKARMEKAGVNPWQCGNLRPSSNRSTAGGTPHGAGAGRGSAVPSAAKSSSNPGLPGNIPAARPAQGKVSFGGLATSKSRLQGGAGDIQFGSVGVYDNPDPLPVSNVKSVAVDNKEVDRVDDQRPQTSGAVEVDSAPLQNVLDDNSALLAVSDVQSVAVGNKEIKQLDRVYEQTGQPPQKSGGEEVGSAPLKNAWGESSALQPKRASPSTNWTTKDAERNKTSDPSSNFLSEEDFPALGGHPSGSKARQGQAWGAEAPGPRRPENVLASKPGVDLRARVEVAQKWGARRDAATSGAEVRGHERDEQFNLSKRGRGGGGNHWRDGGGEWRDPIDSLGRTLTRILRHQAFDLKIKLRSDGYVDVQELLKLDMKTGSGRSLRSHTVEDVLQAVKLDNKQRFGIKEENRVLFIRANQGHTIKTVETEQLLKPVLTAEEIPVCVHGTYRKFLGPIAKEGLKRMSRNHVHFASGLSPSEGVISGMRKTSEILIYLDVSKALHDGMKLYISENGVILTEGFDGVVPPEYFKRVMSWPDNKPVDMK